MLYFCLHKPANRYNTNPANTPIAAITAAAMEQDRENCFLAGMNDLIAKPISPAELVKILSRWLKS